MLEVVLIIITIIILKACLEIPWLRAHLSLSLQCKAPMRKDPLEKEVFFLRETASSSVLFVQAGLWISLLFCMKSTGLYIPPSLLLLLLLVVSSHKLILFKHIPGNSSLDQHKKLRAAGGEENVQLRPSSELSHPTDHLQHGRTPIKNDTTVWRKRRGEKNTKLGRFFFPSTVERQEKKEEMRRRGEGGRENTTFNTSGQTLLNSTPPDDYRRGGGGG